MKRHNVEQGSVEWHQLRESHLCASDAPVMMGDSKYRSRNQLLEEKATGIVPEVSPEKQKLFDRGHEAEVAARETLELEMLEDFSPAVMTAEVDGLSLLASLDGYDGTGTIWEHKLWSDALAENVRNGILDPTYFWQLEHQLLVSGAHRALFTVSDGTSANRETMTYTSDPERRKKLIAGWHRFVDDKANWKPTAKAEVINGAEADGFPLVTYQVYGTAIQSNIEEVLPIIEQRAKEEMARPLETDQDFADKENVNKAVKAARKHLKDVIESVQGEFVSFSEFADIAGKIDATLQKMQSQGEKAVKQAKEAKKDEIAATAQDQLSSYVAECNKSIEPLRIQKIIPISPDWSGAMKNKRTLDSLQNAVDDERNRVYIEIDQVMKVVTENLRYFKTLDYSFLFNDLENIVNQPAESFKAVVQQRIADYEKAEQERCEREEQERAAAEKENLNTVEPAPKEDPITEEQPVTEEQPCAADRIAAWAERWKIPQEALGELGEILDDWDEERRAA